MSVVTKGATEDCRLSVYNAASNLGVAWVNNYEMVLADIPGLIEGAHEGVGLGDRFLRHVERCAAFLHLVDATEDDVAKTYKAIRRELELYKKDLSKKPEVVVLNKIDALDEKEIAKKVKALEEACGRKVFPISAIAKQGLFDCLNEVSRYITKREAGQGRRRRKNQFRRGSEKSLVAAGLTGVKKIGKSS